MRQDGRDAVARNAVQAEAAVGELGEGVLLSPPQDWWAGAET